MAPSRALTDFQEESSPGAPPPLPRFPSYVTREREAREQRSRLASVPSTDAGQLDEDSTPAGSLRRGEALIALDNPFSAEASGNGMSVATQAQMLMNSLRNDESVVAEAVALRRGPFHRVSHEGKRFARWAQVALIEDLPAQLRLLLHPGRRARSQNRFTAAIASRLQDLTPKTKRAVVLIPYVAATIIAVATLIIVLNRGSDTASAPDPITTAPVVLADLPPPEPVAPVRSAAPVAAPATPQPPASKPAGTMVGVRRTLPIKAFLRVKPDARAKKAARVRAGRSVTVYPAFPAPEGWILTTTSNGTIGYIPAANLEGRRDPRLLTRSRAATKKRSRRSVRRRSRRRSRLAPMPGWK